MLTIRPDQLEAMTFGYLLGRRPAFIAHLREFHAPSVAEKDDDGLQRLLADALRKAMSYHLTSTRDICGFLDLVMVFGLDWTIPENAWLHDALAGDSPADAPRRLERLRRRAMYRLDAMTAAGD
jgi:hypothetical protein